MLRLLLALILQVVIASQLQGQLVPFKFSEQIPKWGYKNVNTNQIIIYWHFTKADSFNKYGLAKVGYQNKEGCIDTTGRLIIPFFYKNLVTCNRDSVYINTAHNLLLLRIGNDYFEYKNGTLNKGYPIKDWRPAEVLDVITFQHPRDSKVVDNLITKEFEDKTIPVSKGNSNELSFSSVLSIKEENLVKQPKYWTTSSVQIKFTKFLNTSLVGTRNGTLGITTGYIENKYWGDTAIIKSSQLFIGCSHRIYLGNRTFVAIGAYPVINQIVKSQKRGSSIWNLNNVTYNMSSIFESTFNLAVTHNTLFGIGYKYVPSPYFKSRFQRNFFNINLGFQF